MNITYIATDVNNIKVKVTTEREFVSIFDRNGDLIKSVKYHIDVLDSRNVLRKTIKGFAPLLAECYRHADHPVLQIVSSATAQFDRWYDNLGFFSKLMMDEKEIIHTLCMILQDAVLHAASVATYSMVQQKKEFDAKQNLSE